jgi:hypothetical protein
MTKVECTIPYQRLSVHSGEIKLVVDEEMLKEADKEVYMGSWKLLKKIVQATYPSIPITFGNMTPSEICWETLETKPEVLSDVCVEFETFGRRNLTPEEEAKLVFS